MTLTSYQIGLVGIVLYSFFFVFALYRVYVHMCPYRPPFYSTRKLFHFFLLLYSAFQAVSYISLVNGHDNYEKWSYSCHLIAIFCEIVAFSLVSVLWSKTLMSRNNAKKVVIPFLVFVNSFFLFYVLYIIIDMAYFKGSFISYYHAKFIVKEILIAEPLILTINGFSQIYLGVRIYGRLVSHPSWNSMVSSEKSSILIRLIGTMVVCCCAFLLRASFEIALFINGAKGISDDCWWIFSTWVPTIIPVYVLMYTMRRSDSKIKQNKSNQRYGSNNVLNNSTNLSPLVFGNQEAHYFEEIKGNYLALSPEDGEVYDNDIDDRLRFSQLDLEETGRVNDEDISQFSSPKNQASHVSVDFFKGAPDLRPSFYRTKSNGSNQDSDA